MIKSIPFLKPFALMATGFACLAVQAQTTYTWTNLVNGSWVASTNWNNGSVASGSGNTADFSTLTLGSSRAVTLDGARTIGNLIFGDVGNTYNWALSTGTGGPLTLAGATPTITVNNGMATNSEVLSGTAGMIKAGGGKLVLTTADGYSGGTTVNGGILQLNVGGSTGNIQGALTINSGGSVVTTAGDALGYTAGVCVSTLTINGGNFTNTSGANESYVTQWFLTGGNVVAASGAINFNTGYGITTYASSTLANFNAPISLRASGIGITNALGTVSSGVDMLVGGIISGGGNALIKNGPGTLALGKTNSFGELIIQAGTVQLAASSGGAGCVPSSAIYVLPGAELDFNASDASGYSVALAVTNAGTLKKINAQSETLNRPIVLTNGTITSTSYATSGNGNLEAYNFFGNYIRTMTGTKNLLTGTGHFGLRTSSCYFTNEANSSLTIACVLQQDGNGSGAPLTKTGPGTLILAATNIYTGTTAINGGTLEVDGTTGANTVSVNSGATLDGIGTVNGATTVQSGGILMAGTNGVIGTLSISNSLTLSAGSTNVMRLSKTGGTDVCDQLSVLTSLAYGGTLTVTNVTTDANVLGAGDTFQLFNAASYSGIYATFNLPTLAAGLSWDKSQLLVNGTIKVIAGTATPSFNPPGGGYVGSVSVAISSDAGSTIFYTTDGSDPTTSGTRTAGASPVSGIVIPVGTTETIMAYATNSGTTASPVASATYVTVSTAVWTNTAGGVWPVPVNWNVGAVGNGSGVTADFSTLILPAVTTVTLSGPETIGTLLFEDQGNSYGWILNGAGPLTVDAGVTVPSIVVSNQSVTISTPITGTNGLAISGTGGLMLSSANNSFTGNLTISGVSLTNTTVAGTTTSDLGAKVAGRSVTVNSNATLNFTINNIFGGGGLTNTTLPTLVVNGLMYSTRYNAMPNIVLNGGILDQAASDSGSYQGYQFLGSITVGGAAASTISTDNGKADHLLGSGTIFNVAVTGATGPDLTVSAPLANASGDYGSTAGKLIKTGAGTMAFTSTSTYTGATIVSNGTLEVDGLIGTSAISVNGGVLDGTGTISTAITLNGGTLSSGTAAATGALYNNNALNLSGGTTLLRINKTGGFTASDSLQGITALTFGGTLTVTNITSDANSLADGDSFQLFSANSYAGSFATLNLPPLDAGLVWDLSELASSGTIKVSANTATPVFSPPAGGYVGALTVTITSESGATIYYTTDGTDPTASGTVMSGTSPVTVTVPANTPSLLIQAYAAKTGKGSSGTAAASFSTIDTPTWIAGSGNWFSTGNWLNNVVGRGVDVTADFSTQTLGGDSTVTLDQAPIIGNLIFGDAGSTYNYIIADGGAGPLTLAVSSGSPTITVSNQTTIVLAHLTGTNGLSKAGSGSLVFSNFCTYTGNTVVNAGTLVLATNSVGEGTIDGTLTVNPGAAVMATAGNALGYTNTTTPRVLWVQNLNLYGSTFTTTANGDQGWGLQLNLMGGIFASSGTGARLSAGGGTVINTLATNVSSVLAGTINAREGNSSNQIVFNVADSGGAAAPDLLVNATIAGTTAGVGIVKNGPGVMSLAAASTFSGATVVSNGVLQLTGGGGSAGTLSNSTVTVESGAELQLFTGDGLGYAYNAVRTLTLNGGTLREINTNSDTLSRPITLINGTITANSGAGLVVGNLTGGLAGDCYNLYNATAVITTAPGTTNYISLPAGDNFALRGGSISNATGSYLIVNGVLDGWGGSASFGLTKTGAGGLILNSNNIYAGVTAISGGNLEVDGSISNGTVTVSGGILDGTGTINGAATIQSGATLMAGTLANIGTLSVSNVLTLGAGSTNVMRINKAGSTFTSDLLNGMSELNFGGTLVLTATGDALAAGDTFQLYNSSTYSGSFAATSLPVLAGGLSWDLSQLAVNGTIRVIGGTGTPVFSPAGGSYIGSVTVTITSDAGSTIFYTTDGSTPTSASLNGPSPITGIIVPVSTTETIRAYATNSTTSPSLLSSATYVTIPTAVWTNTAGGTWPVPANWNVGAVGNGSGVTADFSTLTLTANTTVLVGSPETIGTLVFGDQGNAFGWTLNGSGPLTLDAGATVPSIVVNDQSITVATPMAGTNGLIKAGTGTLVLTGAETYTGNTTVNGGNLTLTIGGAGGELASHTLTINPGASVTATATNALGYTGTAWVTNLNIIGGTFTSTSSGDQGWGINVNLMGGTLAASGAVAHFTMGGGWVNNTIATNVTSVISGTINTRNGQVNNLIPFNVAAGTASPDLLVSAAINNVQPGVGLAKAGAGVMVLTATNTYSGSTVVSNGTLEVDGSIANGEVAISGGTLCGAGIIGGDVTVIGGTLAAGTTTGIGTLVINNTLSVSSGSVVLRANKTGGVLTNDNVQGLQGLTYGGTLTVTASGSPLASGDKLTLFASTGYAGSFSTLNLPALGTGLGWDTSRLTVDGSIQVGASVNTAPTNIVATVNGSTLSLSWPADHLGWRLLVQTNHLAAGLSTDTNDWATVFGSAGINQTNITIDPAKPSEFYRLVYP